MVGIYKITSPSGRVYIGQSNNVEYRWIQYKYYKYDYINLKSLIHKSLRKYGYDKHLFEILEECLEEELNEREIFWIKKLRVNYVKYPKKRGLNLHDGGNTPPKRAFGYKMSQESKDKISNGNKLNHKTNPKMGMRNKSHPKAMIIIDLETGIYYHGLQEVAYVKEKSIHTISNWLKRKDKMIKNV